MAGPEFPAFLKIEHRRDPSTKSAFLADVEQIVGPAESRLRAFSVEATRQLDAAMSLKRNSVGSLDLGVDELRAAASAQQARAIAAREVANATALAAKEEGDYSQQTRSAVVATQALAREEEAAARAALSHANAAEQIQERLNRQASSTDMVVLATKRGTDAQRQLASSTAAVRNASVMAGQQFQDIAISLYSGQRASVVFAQQLPQLAFAMTGLEGSSNKALDKLGKLGVFLSGPWGLAFGLGVGVAGTLIARLFATGDAADDAKNSVEALTKKLLEGAETARNSELAHAAFNKTLEGQIALQLKLTETIDGTTKSRREATDELLRSARTGAANFKVEQGRTTTDLADAKAHLGRVQRLREDAFRGGANEATINSHNRAVAAANAEVTRLEERLKVVAAQASAAEVAVNKALIVVKTDEAKALVDPIAAINREYDKRIDDAKAAAATNRTLAETFDQTAAAIDRERNAKIKAAEASDKLLAANRQFGREIDHTAARSIAERAGMRVTSDLRSRAEQQWLYDNRRTPTNPVARPGTSAHEKGNALDIAFGAGISPASIRKAFAEEGVRLTKILKEDGHFHIEWSTSGADKAQREAEKLAEFGKSATESIARITEQFDDQPRLIDRAAQATRQLDKLIGELKDNQPNGFEGLIRDAQTAQQVIAEGVFRPFRDFMEDSQRAQQLQKLILAGREDEADVMQIMFRLEDQIGSEQELRLRIQTLLTQGRTEEAAVLQRMLDKYPTMRREVMGVVQAQRQQTEELEAQRAMMEAYTRSISGVQSSIEGLLSGNLSGKGFFKDMKANFKQLQAQTLTEKFFGQPLRHLEKEIRKSTGVKSATDEFNENTAQAAASAGTVATSFEQASERIDRLFQGYPVDPTFGANSPASSPMTFEQAFAHIAEASSKAQGSASANDNEMIVVNGAKAPPAIQRGVMAMSPQSYFSMLSTTMTGSFAKMFDEAIGLTMPKEMQGIMARGLEGLITGGAPGGILGAMKGVMFEYGPDMFGKDGKAKTDKVLEKLDKAMGGAQTGTQVAGIMKGLGIKTSTTGAQIGGSVGALTQIPGMDIVGSIAGGIIGGMLKKTKKGKASFVDGELVIEGNSGKREKAAGDAAGAIKDSLSDIADKLDAKLEMTLGRVTIAMRDGNWRVDNTGMGNTKTSKGAIDFGQDQEAAIQAALSNLIADGVLTGLDQAEMRLLKSGAGDIDKAVEKVLDFQDVFKRLKQFKDPVGAAIDDLNDEFQGLIKLFNEAGASAEQFAQLEELYGLERAEAIKQATNSMVSSLQSFYDQLTIGDSSLSLRDRRDAAIAKYAPLAERVRAGDSTASEDFIDAANALLDIERQISGSQVAFFGLHKEIKDLTAAAMAAQSSAAAGYIDRDNPFSNSPVQATDNTAVVSALDNLGGRLLEGLGYRLDAVNTNLGKMIANGTAGSNSGLLSQHLASASNF